MATLKFQCNGRNEYLNGDQKAVSVSFTPVTNPSVSPVPVTASGFSMTYNGDVSEAEQFKLGETYNFSFVVDSSTKNASQANTTASPTPRA
jgi:hypothetical protein